MGLAVHRVARASAWLEGMAQFALSCLPNLFFPTHRHRVPSPIPRIYLHSPAFQFPLPELCPLPFDTLISYPSFQAHPNISYWKHMQNVPYPIFLCTLPMCIF